MSRAAVKQRILKLYDVKRASVVNNLANCVVSAFTVDTWTGCNDTCFCSLTVHGCTKWELQCFALEVSPLNNQHTALHLGETINRMVESWNLSTTGKFVVTDNARNIVSAINDYTEMQHFPCFAHTLQLSLKEGLSLPHVEETLKIARTIVAFFNHSPSRIEMLRRECESRNPPVAFRKLKQETPTRWGSTFKMLQSLYSLRSPLRDVLESTHIEIPSTEFWQKAKSLIDILDPLNCITEQLSAQNVTTLSSIYPILINLTAKILASTGDQFSDRFRRTVKDSIEKRFNTSSIRSVMQVSCILDPRFKKLPFLNQTAKTSAKKIAIDHIKKASNGDDSNTSISSTDSEPATTTATTNSLASIYGASLFSQSSSVKTVEQEMAEYLCSPPLSFGDDPLQWWKENSENLPRMAKVAAKLLPVPATSVPSERLFSKSGLILRSRRSRLSGEMVNKLLFLSENSDLWVMKLLFGCLLILYFLVKKWNMFLYF